MKYLFFLLLFSSTALAQISSPTSVQGSEVVPVREKPEVSPFEKAVEDERPLSSDSTVEKGKEKVEEIKKSAASSAERRENSHGSIMVGYQLLTTWLPSKKTVGYTHIFNKKWSLEGEYSWGSFGSPSIIGVDLGEVKEKRFALQARRYAGNSFNFTFGAVYSDLNAHVGSDIVASGSTSSFKAQNLGLTGGFGNRWQFSHGITFGVDWLRVNIPLIQTRVEDKILSGIPNGSDQTDIKNIIRTFNRIPTVVLFGLNVGYTF